MKEKLLTILFLGYCGIAFSQEIIDFQTLSPSINLTEDNNQKRTIVFYSPSAGYDDKRWLCYNIKTKEEYLLNADNSEFIPKDIYGFYWDPYKKTNYAYLEPRSQKLNIQEGWSEIHYDKGKGVLIIKDFLDDLVFHSKRSSFDGMFSDSKYYLEADYKYSFDKESLKSSYFEELKIIDSTIGSTIWELSSVGDHSSDWHNIYWIRDEWILVDNSISAPKNNTILNFVTKEQHSFAPDKIIGYGRGYIITTSERFIGITVIDPDGTIIYQDKEFDLVGMLRDTILMKKISFAYFDSPFIYYVVYAGSGGMMPARTVIIDTMENKSYMTSTEISDLLGIF